MDFLNLRGVLCAAAALIWHVAATADQQETVVLPDASYDMRQPMHPTPAGLASKGKGPVHIYDSLQKNAANTAVDESYDGFQKVTLTPIHNLPPTGLKPAAIKDDGLPSFTGCPINFLCSDSAYPWTGWLLVGWILLMMVLGITGFLAGRSRN